jgi:UDP-N-acetylglucosamine--N-acetylmuramyl-(pentapeptide) pyrophosphoryl-undecaprenol N-acetylglucosamine transferase
MERQMIVVRHFVLAAGGTGGHMIPAQALAAELRERGHFVELITDQRGADLPIEFDGVPVHVLPAGRFERNPRSWLRAIRATLDGRAEAMALYGIVRPTAVIGFGGYPALPALLGAIAVKVPTVIHEQNAVLGRVNRLLARFVNVIATAYETVERVAPAVRDKLRLVGNPVRREVLALRDQPYPALTDDGVFRVLVTGGSQGATVLSDVVPEALSLLPPALKHRLQVVQQCRPEDIDRVRRTYVELGIPAELATYIQDMPDRIGWSHLVIARAGASTIAELTVAGRPAVLVPLPSAMDDHQTVNAREMVASGGARMIKQRRFTPVELGKQMQKLGLSARGLTRAAACARECGRPQAARDLADLLESMGAAPDGDVVPMRRRRPVIAPGMQGAAA